MSDTNTVPQGTDPSAAPPVIPQAPPPVVAPPKADVEPEVRMTPAQLTKRLAEERAKGERDKEAALAAMLGGDLQAAKALIAEAKAKDDAQKSEVQKLTEQLAAKDAKLSRLAALEEAVSARAASEFDALSDVQKTAVQDLAGDDPAARLRTIEKLRPTWAAVQKASDDAAKAAAAQAAADAAKAAEEAKAKAKIPAPASTTPAAPPPPPANPGTPTNHLAVWEAMKAANPAMAARYRVTHDAAIRAAQRQATG
jgi:hypothetical protein